MNNKMKIEIMIKKYLSVIAIIDKKLSILRDQGIFENSSISSLQDKKNLTEIFINDLKKLEE